MKPDCIDHGITGKQGGYAQRRHAGKLRLVHRLAFCAANNLDIEEIDGKLVLHSCDNPRCINPDHLRLGSNADNMRDMSIRSRAGGKKLTPDQVLEIRARCKPGRRGGIQTESSHSYMALARAYGVDVSTVRSAYLGLTHKYIGETA